MDALSPPAEARRDVPADDPGDLPELVQLAEERAAAAESANTRRVYRRGWDHFAAFCERRGLDALPARPEVVGLFVERMASDGYALSTIDTRLAAIRRRHETAGERSPTGAPAVRKQRANVERTQARDPDRKEPVLIEDLQAMDFDPSELSALRDRAVLFVGFALSCRRSELVGLEMRDLRPVKGGIIYTIRDPKAQDTPHRVQIPDRVPALQPTPNDALQAWTGAAGIERGPLFRMVDRWGNVRDGALSGQSVYQIVRDRMESIGNDPEPYGAHSLRAGFVTQAYMDGIGEQEAAAQTGHSKLDTLREYQRVNVVMDNHPLSRMGTDT